MCLIVLAYERAMERTPESEADKAAPIVPDERENTAKGLSISPREVQNEKSDPHKMCSARSWARKSERCEEISVSFIQRHVMYLI